MNISDRHGHPQHLYLATDTPGVESFYQRTDGHKTPSWQLQGRIKKTYMGNLEFSFYVCLQYQLSSGAVQKYLSEGGCLL